MLHKITEHLIEEASTEEEELLGLEASSETSVPEQADPELMRVLDRLVLYLRIVHSVDYYNHCEYPYEDEMPNRCGIMHARSGPPANKVQIILVFDIYAFTLPQTFAITISTRFTANSARDTRLYKNI